MSQYQRMLRSRTPERSLGRSECSGGIRSTSIVSPCRADVRSSHATARAKRIEKTRSVAIKSARLACSRQKRPLAHARRFGSSLSNMMGGRRRLGVFGCELPVTPGWGIETCEHFGKNHYRLALRSPQLDADVASGDVPGPTFRRAPIRIGREVAAIDRERPTIDRAGMTLRISPMYNGRDALPLHSNAAPVDANMRTLR